MKPDISIIVPVYNVEEYLEQCLDSILRQTLQSFEIIIVYDHSLDNSLEICQSYAGKYDKIRLFVREQNIDGLSGARNLGIREAKGEYILFVDSDDYLHEELCERTLSKAIQYDAEVVSFEFFLCEWSVKEHKMQDGTLIEIKYFAPEFAASVSGRLLTKDEAFVACATNTVWATAFNKLFKKKFS